MKQTKEENPLAGLTKKAQAGAKSLPVMKDGEEPPEMLLALLNNVLPSMVDSQQAKITGSCLTKRGRATIVLFYGVVPTSGNLLAKAAE